MKKQIGCCFIIDGQEFIYEGSYPSKNSKVTCNICGKPIKGKMHIFFSSDGYHDATHTIKSYNAKCVRSIIQAGYKKSI